MERKLCSQRKIKAARGLREEVGAND